jgi:hypothetical protein
LRKGQLTEALHHVGFGEVTALQQGASSAAHPLPAPTSNRSAAPRRSTTSREAARKESAGARPAQAKALAELRAAEAN